MFGFSESELLEKNGQCNHFIIGLNILHLIRMKCLPLYLKIKKRYIKYHKSMNVDT